MPDNEPTPPASRFYMPSMTGEYSRISDTAGAVDLFVLPGILSYLESIRETIAGMPAGAPLVIADYGAADGANSSQLFESIIRYVREVNPALGIQLVYIDIADPAPFDRFREGSHLSELHDVEAEYIQRSFYEPFPELAGSVHIGFSSTALHWLDTQTADADLFRHPSCIQANQLSESGCGKYVEKWKCDWRIFFRERSRELVDGGLLFLANLTSLGGDRWPASAGYDNLRDVCYSLYKEGRDLERRAAGDLHTGLLRHARRDEGPDRRGCRPAVLLVEVLRCDDRPLRLLLEDVRIAGGCPGETPAGRNACTGRQGVERVVRTGRALVRPCQPHRRNVRAVGGQVLRFTSRTAVSVLPDRTRQSERCTAVKRHPGSWRSPRPGRGGPGLLSRRRGGGGPGAGGTRGRASRDGPSAHRGAGCTVRYHYLPHISSKAHWEAESVWSSS